MGKGSLFWPFLWFVPNRDSLGKFKSMFGMNLRLESEESERYIPAAFFLSMPFPTQFSAAVTTVGSEKPSTLFTVFSIHGFSSSSSRLDSAILGERRTTARLGWVTTPKTNQARVREKGNQTKKSGYSRLGRSASPYLLPIPTHVPLLYMNGNTCLKIQASKEGRVPLAVLVFETGAHCVAQEELNTGNPPASSCPVRDSGSTPPCPSH